VLYVVADGIVTVRADTANMSRRTHLPPSQYRTYLASGAWKRRRLEELRKADHTCWACRAAKDARYLHVHHKTYAFLGCERQGDLVVLCEDCHNLAHKLVDGGGAPLARAHTVVRQSQTRAATPKPKPKTKTVKTAKVKKGKAGKRAARAKAKAATKTRPLIRLTAKEQRLEEIYAKRRADHRRSERVLPRKERHPKY
jgi:5-methylcytosine-specific restriction endonuclease McrA